jgi:hypothetical protein
VLELFPGLLGLSYRTRVIGLIGCAVQPIGDSAERISVHSGFDLSDWASTGSMNTASDIIRGISLAQRVRRAREKAEAEQATGWDGQWRRSG